MRHGKRSTLRDEVANGLVLEDDFYAGLAEFEQNPNKTAQDFFAELLAAVNE